MGRALARSFFLRGYLPALQVLPRHLGPRLLRSSFHSGRRGFVLANCYRCVLGAGALSWRIVGVQLRAVAAGFALARTCRAAFARISRVNFHLAQFRQL